MARKDLPDCLGDRFTTADAIAAGVSRSRLRSGDLAHPFRGVHERNDLDDPFERMRGEFEAEHLRRALAYARCMGDHVFFSHVTAAVIWGVPLPLWVLVDAPIHVAVVAPARLPRAKGVRGHQTTKRLARVMTDPTFGLRVASPATTWAMSASYLTNLADVVAVGDAIVRTWRVDEPLATLDQLAAATTAGRRVGINRLRIALGSVRMRSASRPETHQRLLLISAGFGEPQLNYEIYDEDGKYLGAADTAYPERLVSIEYEGDHHRTDPEQWARDIRRYAAMRDAGWTIVNVTRDDLFGHPERLVTTVRRALASRADT